MDSEAGPSQKRPLPSRLAMWNPPLFTPAPYAGSPPKITDTALQYSSSNNCQHANPTPTSRRHEQQHARRPRSPQAPARRCHMSTDWSTLYESNIHDALPTHKHRLPKTDRQPSARSTTISPCTTPPQLTSTSNSVQVLYQPHDKHQKQHAEHTPSPPSPDNWYSNSTNHTTSTNGIM